MHVCMSAVPPLPRSRQGKKTSFGGVPRRSHIKEKRGRGGLQKRCLTFDLTERQFVKTQRSMSVPNLAPLLRAKVLKSALKACSWCEMPHSPFYWPLLRTCENPNDAKQRDVAPLAKWRQSHAWKSVRRANSRPLIGQFNFSSVSQGRFLLKKKKKASSATAAGFEELRRCH